MEDGRVMWRGYITPVPSKEMVYFEDLRSISQFILPYLEKLGAVQEEPVVQTRPWKASQIQLETLKRRAKRQSEYTGME